MGRRRRFGSATAAETNVSPLGGVSFQPFSTAVAWRVLSTAATLPDAARMARTSASVSASLL